LGGFWGGGKPTLVEKETKRQRKEKGCRLVGTHPPYPGLGLGFGGWGGGVSLP